MKTNLHLNRIDPDRFAEKILTLLNSNKPKDFLFADIVTLVQKETQIESIGLRLIDGFDYPYYVNSVILLVVGRIIYATQFSDL